MRSIQLEEVLTCFNRNNLGTALNILGALSSLLQFENYENTYSTRYYDVLAQWMKNKIYENPINKIALQVNLPRMTRFLLLSNSSERKQGDYLLPHRHEFNKAYNYCSNLHQDGLDNISNINDLSRVFARIAQWQSPLHDQPFDYFGRAYALFIDLPTKLNMHSDFEDILYSKTGMTIEEYICTGFYLGITTRGAVNTYRPEKSIIENTPIKESSIKRFISCTYCTQQKYKEIIRGKERWKYSNPEKDIYSLDPLRRYPFVYCRKSKYFPDEKFFLPINLYCFHMASVGLFYLLSLFSKQEGSEDNSNRFRTSFGHVFEDYIERQLNPSKNCCRFVNLNSVQELENVKKPDFLIISDRRAVLLEVKTTLLSQDATCIATKEYISQSLVGFTRALDQLDSFASTIKEARIDCRILENIDEIVFGIVTFNQTVYGNSHYLPIMFAESKMHTKHKIQLLSIYDIERMSVAISKGYNIVDLIYDKVNDDEHSEHDMHVYINNRFELGHTKNPYLSESYERMWADWRRVRSDLD